MEKRRHENTRQLENQYRAPSSETIGVPEREQTKQNERSDQRNNSRKCPRREIQEFPD